MKIAVAGAGTMGTRLALRCAAHGCDTVLIGRDAARADAALREAARAEAVDADGVRVSANLDDAAGAELVAETIGEDLPLKRELYEALEARIGDRVPIASGTSTFPPGVLNERMRRPGRLLVAHMVHPVTLVPLAELIAPDGADPGALGTVERWLDVIAMRAVRLRAPVAGFIVNRLQFALLREAAFLVEAGIADAADVDAIVEYGLGPRWSATGPLASVDLGGARTFGAIAARLTPELDARPGIPLLENGSPVRALSDAQRDGARARRRAVYAAVERARGS